MTRSQFRVVALAFVLAFVVAFAGALPGRAMPRSAMTSVEVVAPANPEHIPLRVGSFGSAIALGIVAGPRATAGELAGSAEASGQDPKLSERVAGQKLLLGDELARAMESALKKRGFNAFAKGGTAPA